MKAKMTIVKFPKKKSESLSLVEIMALLKTKGSPAERKAAVEEELHRKSLTK